MISKPPSPATMQARDEPEEEAGNRF
jgi:hypothetical protein